MSVYQDVGISTLNKGFDPTLFQSVFTFIFGIFGFSIYAAGGVGSIISLAIKDIKANFLASNSIMDTVPQSIVSYVINPILFLMGRSAIEGIKTYHHWITDPIVGLATQVGGVAQMSIAKYFFTAYVVPRIWYWTLSSLMNWIATTSKLKKIERDYDLTVLSIELKAATISHIEILQNMDSMFENLKLKKKF